MDLDKVILIDEGKVIAMGTPKEILASNILPRIGLREPIYIEALKRLHFDRNNDVIYPMENLQKEKVSNVIKEWMEKQVILKRNAKTRNYLKWRIYHFHTLINKKY